MTAVAVIGTGAIGGAVADALDRGEVHGCTLVAALDSRTPRVQLEAAVTECDIVVEATNHTAARGLIQLAMSADTDILVCSCGVLADGWEALRSSGRVLLPAGAIGGFDALAAAARVDGAIAEIEHISVKAPAALGLQSFTGAAIEVFRGSAREAARRYPRTSNASIALGFATVGIDRLEVVVLADPAATSTRHTVRWKSPIGSYEFHFQNAVEQSSGGRTSRLTAWSVLETLAGVARGVGPGVVVIDGSVALETCQKPMRS